MMTSTDKDACCPTEKMIVDYDECKKAAGFLNVKWNHNTQNNTRMLPGCYRITGGEVVWNKSKTGDNSGSLHYPCKGVCRQ